jgi:hypothetical protein
MDKRTIWLKKSSLQEAIKIKNLRKRRETLMNGTRNLIFLKMKMRMMSNMKK